MRLKPCFLSRSARAGVEPPGTRTFCGVFADPANLEAPSTAFFAIVSARLVRATATAMKPSETHLQRQVDTLLASLEGALESDESSDSDRAATAAHRRVVVRFIAVVHCCAIALLHVGRRALPGAESAAPVTMPAVPPPGAANALTLEQLEAQLNAPAAEPAPCLPVRLCGLPLAAQHLPRGRKLVRQAAARLAASGARATAGRSPATTSSHAMCAARASRRRSTW